MNKQCQCKLDLPTSSSHRSSRVVQYKLLQGLVLRHNFSTYMYLSTIQCTAELLVNGPIYQCGSTNINLDILSKGFNCLHFTKLLHFKNHCQPWDLIGKNASYCFVYKLKQFGPHSKCYKDPGALWRFDNDKFILHTQHMEPGSTFLWMKRNFAFLKF